MRHLLLIPGLILIPAAHAAESALELADGRVPVAEALGADVPLYLTVANRAAAPDALLRVRCPVAHFTEKRTVDKGEGGTAFREVSSIPIPAQGTLELGPEGFHVVLLQTTQALRQGDSFTCALSFKQAGPQQLQVTVTAP